MVTSCFHEAALVLLATVGGQSSAADHLRARPARDVLGSIGARWSCRAFPASLQPELPGREFEVAHGNPHVDVLQIDAPELLLVALRPLQIQVIDLAIPVEEELFPGPSLMSPGSLTLPSATTSWFGNINPIPFRWAAQIALLIRH